MAIKITEEVRELLSTEAGRQKLIALKLCELVEEVKRIKTISAPNSRSMWETIFGHKGNEL